MRRLKFQLDRKSLQTIYISFIRPLLEYADVVWDIYTQQEANELEKIQNEAARIVTGATKLASIQSLLESLTLRREKHKLVLFYKMINYLAPEYLSSLVPPTCLFVFVALRPKSTAMVIAGRSVNLATLFPGQA